MKRRGETRRTTVLVPAAILAVLVATGHPACAGQNTLEFLTGARITRNSAGEGGARFSRGHLVYRITRLPDGVVTIGDAQGRRFNDVLVGNVATLHFADGWNYRVADGHWEETARPAAAPLARHGAVVRAPVIASPSAKGDLVGLKLVNRTNQSTRPQAVTFGQIFIAGTVRAGDAIEARIGTRRVPVQADIKTRYADGSVKHAVLTLPVPTLATDGAVDVMLTATGAKPTVAPVSAEAVLAGGYALTLWLRLKDGTVRELDAADLLRRTRNAGTLDVWLTGPLVSEFRVEARIDPNLRATFDIRAYADGRVRTGIMVANDTTWTPNSRTLSYRAEIMTAEHPRFAADLVHYRAANWHRVVWSGTAADQITDLAVVRDVDYLIRSGAVPAFDTTLGVAATALEEMAGALAKTDTGPLGNALIVKYMPTTGGRADIGILPSWTAAYLVSQDARAERVMLAAAAASGSVPWHFHDETTGHWVRIDQHPRLWLDARARATTVEPPATPLIGLEAETGWTIDDAHTPSLAFVPYLLTGERYYLDEAQAVGAWRLASFNPAYRGNVMAKQVRALAWELRDLGDIAYISPDNHPLKAYFAHQINTELTLLHETYLERRVMRAAGEVEGWFMGDASRVPGGLGPWQVDFMVVALAGLTGHGFAQARDLLNWSVNFVAGRFISGERGFDPLYGPAYVLKLFDPATKIPVSTWRGLFVGSFPDAGPHTDFLPGSYPSCALCFVAVAKAALAAAITVTQSPRALQAYNFLVAHTPPDGMDNYRKVSNWAIRPRLPDGRYVSIGEAVPVPLPARTQ